ncbi:hypothetical protein ZOSMA_178G00550, partial [Zostera marina]
MEGSLPLHKGRNVRGILRRRSSSPWTVVLGILLMLSMSLLILLSLGIFSIPISSDSPGDIQHIEIKLPTQKHEELEEKRKWTEILSWEPRAFLYHNFLSKEECNHLIELAKPRMKMSTVV